MISASLADNTVKSYATAVSKFDMFRSQYNLSNSWPPMIDDLINFIAYLSTQGYKSSTARSYVAGISFYIRINNWPDPSESFVVRKMLKGFQRISPIKDTRAPVTLKMLLSFPLSLKNVTSSSYEALLFSTAFSVAFFGFLRVGEMVADSKTSDTSRIILISDVAILSGNISITLRFSKTDQLGKSVTLVFYPCEQKQICPVSLIKRYMQVRPKIQGPLFCHYSGEPLTRYQFATILQKVIRFSGFDTLSTVKCHSFRIGAATLASSQNVSDALIKEMGRWSEQSSSYKRYIRLDKIKA